MRYKYYEVLYDMQRELMTQVNEECRKHPGVRFLSIAQKIAKVYTTGGTPQTQIVLIFEQREVIHDEDKS